MRFAALLLKWTMLFQIFGQADHPAAPRLGVLLCTQKLCDQNTGNRADCARITEKIRVKLPHSPCAKKNRNRHTLHLVHRLLLYFLSCKMEQIDQHDHGKAIVDHNRHQIVDRGESFVVGTGETFYKASVDATKVFPDKNILRDNLHRAIELRALCTGVMVYYI